ncbi:MAG: helix-turn-helix domain-containing protein [Bacteroidota bacterium]
MIDTNYNGSNGPLLNSSVSGKTAYNGSAKNKELVFELSKNLNSFRTSEEVLTFCVREFIPHFHLTDFVIYKYASQSKSLFKCASQDKLYFDTHADKNLLVLPLGSGIVGQTASKKHSHLVNDTENNQNYIVDDVKRYSELSTPIIFKGKLIGVMDSENEEKDFYSQDLKDVFETLSMIIAPYLKDIALSSKENSYLLKLQSLLEDDQCYLDKDINLDSIAEQLAITPGYLSALIHQNGLECFRSYVNGFRINHFLELYKSNRIDSYSILSLAYASGFASKATFNRAFKKHTGMTPKGYLKR